VSEYPPDASGIGNVARFVAEEFIKKGHQCTICSPSGPDITIGDKNYINKFGGLGIIHFWYQVSKYFDNNYAEFDAIWLHQPLFVLKKCPFPNGLITVHTTYAGKSLKNYLIQNKIYLILMKLFEKYYFCNVARQLRYTYISNKVLDELISIGIQNRCTFISNGVDISKFNRVNKKRTIIDKTSFDRDTITFISVGRITDVKRPFLMVDLFSSIHKVIEDSTLVIVGKGNKLNEIKEYVSNKKITNIKFMGFVDHFDLPPLYSCSNYFLITSEYEGQPLTLLEAMASGLPCIVSDIPNLRIVEEANCGIVVDFSDEENAAQKIIDYVNQDNSEHGENARKHAEEHLDWSIIAEKYLELLNRENFKKDSNV
jgi:glycosyltransferase involved in cell wall biosynthesis